jgi:carbonic anhydrase/acetyltransferase-like protein (isoleucine patch superfamily)
LALLIEHRGKTPRIDASAHVAPNAVISGDVTIGAHGRVLFGAIITAEGGPVVIGENCIIMETAVLRGTPQHRLRLGDHVLVGPRAYLTGCTVEDSVFLATGTTIFNGAYIGERSEVRVNGVVHLLTRLPPDSLVPIGWIAVGDPAIIRAPQNHDEIWAVQQALNFSKVVWGLERAPERETIMPEITTRYAKALARHSKDRILSGQPERPS